MSGILIYFYSYKCKLQWEKLPEKNEKKLTKLWHLYLNYEIKSSNNNDVHEIDKQFIALKSKV